MDLLDVWMEILSKYAMPYSNTEIRSMTMLQEPHEDIFLEQSSPPHTPAPESPPSPSTRQADRSPRLRATAKSRDFRRVSSNKKRHLLLLLKHRL
jgi:hypothetical protein